MKTRESGMPEEALWSTFFDTEYIFSQLELDSSISTVVDLGAGYGTFAIPAAKIISGHLHAFEFEKILADKLQLLAEKEELSNLVIHNRDFLAQGINLEDDSADYVMLFNILHALEADEMLSEACRILTPGGKLGVIHWRYDSSTPRGPAMEIRPKPEELKTLMKQAGFGIKKFNINLPPFHYGILGIK